MFNKSVAVLDIRSYEVTCAVAERGVNDTFIIKSKNGCAYDGYAEGEFLDKQSFFSAVKNVVTNTLSAINKSVKKFYVGVPGEFVKVISTDKTISFSSVKKIKKSDCDYVSSLSMPEDNQKYVNVYGGCIYYSLSDKRRTVYPIGETSDLLQAKLCYFMVDRNFISCVESAFRESGVAAELSYIPVMQAEAMYLIPPEKRDTLNILFDFGYISSTFSVICGNGVMYSESFSIGVGHLAYLLSSEFDMPYDAAYACLQKVNLNAKEKSDGKIELKINGELKSFSQSKLREQIRLGLDGVCETIEECIRGYSVGDIAGIPLNITGEGANVIRGASEHISSRLVRSVQTASPALPYYDKPQLSSLFSLFNSALDDLESTSFFSRK